MKIMQEVLNGTKIRFFKGRLNSLYVDEASPGYLFYSEKVVHRIQETFQGNNPKFIVIFRDPVARAYSAYWHLRNYGGEQLSFRKSLIAEEERLKLNSDRLNASGFIKFAYF